MVSTKKGDDALVERLRKICLALPEAESNT